VPLGYELERGGGLAVNEEEAARVRAIFDLFVESRSLIATVEELSNRGWTTKRWTTREGNEHPGRAFAEKSLARLLANPVYAGSTRDGDKLYRGEQRAIVSERLWKRVNCLLGKMAEQPRKERNKTGAPLKGLLRCGGCGLPMTVTCTGKQQRRYRYYVCRSPQHHAGCGATRYVPAEAIERSVLEKLREVKGGVIRRALKADVREPAAAAHVRMSAQLRSVVDAVIYDAATSDVTIRMRPPKGDRRAQ
jgi:site-specific DNA recombinase